jgi:hypothetical protein
MGIADGSGVGDGWGGFVANNLGSETIAAARSGGGAASDVSPSLIGRSGALQVASVTSSALAMISTTRSIGGVTRRA